MLISIFSTVICLSILTTGCVSVKDEPKKLLEGTEYDLCYAATSDSPLYENSKKAAASI